MAGIGKYKKGAKFTLKSGNKVSFRDMGSSPVKQTDYTQTAVNEGLVDKKANPESNQQQADLSAKTLEAKYREERRKATQDAVSNIPTAAERRAENIKAAGTEGQVEGVDYKTTKELRKDRKARRQERKGIEDPKERRDQKIADKITHLENKRDRQKGTGKSKVTFNWKKAVLGGSSAAGVGHRPAHEATQERINRKKNRLARRKKNRSLK